MPIINNPCKKSPATPEQVATCQITLTFATTVEASIPKGALQDVGSDVQVDSTLAHVLGQQAFRCLNKPEVISVLEISEVSEHTKGRKPALCIKQLDGTWLLTVK